MPVKKTKNYLSKLENWLFECPNITCSRLDIVGTPLSLGQSIEASEDNESAVVTSSFRDTQEIRPWSLAPGSRVEVMNPT